MSDHIYQSNDLESSIRKQVKIYSSTRNGLEISEGIVKSIRFPDELYMHIPPVDFDELGKGERDLSFPFAGWDHGIIKIEYDGKAMYHNSAMPEQYPIFSCVKDEDLIKLNQFRTECFGPGHEF